MDENNNPIQEPGVKTEERTTTETTQNTGTRKTSAMALVSFIFSIVGLIIAALPCGIVALITGIIGVAKFNPAKDSGKGLAIAGIIIGIVDIIAGIANIFLQVATLSL